MKTDIYIKEKKKIRNIHRILKKVFNYFFRLIKEQYNLRNRCSFFFFSFYNIPYQ